MKKLVISFLIVLSFIMLSSYTAHCVMDNQLYKGLYTIYKGAYTAGGGRNSL